MNNLLLVEDDENLGTVLKEFLKVKGFQVMLARDGEEGSALFDTNDFDLCILDVMLPKKDGFTLAREIRNTDKETPILFLTAKSLIEDKAEGFAIGGDDYLTKPFSMEELTMRINALLKRRHSQKSEDELRQTFDIGSFTFDYALRKLLAFGKENKMTTREAELLRLLCLNEGKVLKRETALTKIWGDDSYFNGRSMDVFITKLRKHLKADERVNILNVHGEGFKLVISA